MLKWTGKKNNIYFNICVIIYIDKCIKILYQFQKKKNLKKYNNSRVKVFNSGGYNTK